MTQEIPQILHAGLDFGPLAQQGVGETLQRQRVCEFQSLERDHTQHHRPLEPRLHIIVFCLDDRADGQKDRGLHCRVRPLTINLTVFQYDGPVPDEI